MKIPGIHLHFYEGVNREELCQLEERMDEKMATMREEIEAKVDEEIKQVRAKFQEKLDAGLADLKKQLEESSLNARDKEAIFAKIDSISESTAEPEEPTGQP